MNNVVILVGRIARNIELKKTTSGLSICNITLAVTRNYKNSEGIYETDFITCVCFKETAERVAEYCNKGDLVGIKGSIQIRSYEKDGKKVYATDIIVDKLNFLSQASKKVEEKVVEEKKEDPYEVFSKENNIEEMELPF